MKVAAWNNLRARLHHDWLKNRYQTFLMARVNNIDQLTTENKSVRQDIIEQFTEWQDKAKDFGTFIDEAIEALSPRQLFEEYPLNRMSHENKAWLSELVHAMYCERTGMSEKVKELREKYRLICDTYDLLSEILKGKNGDLKKKAGEPPFKRFCGHVQEFSKMISALPHEVQVV